MYQILGPTPVARLVMSHSLYVREASPHKNRCIFRKVANNLWPPQKKCCELVLVFPNLFKSPLYGKKTYPQKLWNGVESIALWLFCYGRLPSVWIVFGNNPVSIELRRRRGESRKGGSGGQAFCFWVNLTPRTSSKHNSMSIVLNTHSRQRKVNLFVPKRTFISLELI